MASPGTTPSSSPLPPPSLSCLFSFHVWRPEIIPVNVNPQKVGDWSASAQLSRKPGKNARRLLQGKKNKRRDLSSCSEVVPRNPTPPRKRPLDFCRGSLGAGCLQEGRRDSLLKGPQNDQVRFVFIPKDITLAQV